MCVQVCTYNKMYDIFNSDISMSDTNLHMNSKLHINCMYLTNKLKSIRVHLVPESKMYTIIIITVVPWLVSAFE